MTPAQQRQFATITAELGRLVRYDDESVVHDEWIRQRYDGGYAASYLPARKAAVVTAWHEAGHVVAALATGARFTSASIRHSVSSKGVSGEGRVHAVTTGGNEAFVIHAAGQIAERLRDWTTLDEDAALAAWLAAWRADGGDAKHFRDALRPRTDTRTEAGAEVAAWRYAEQILTPLRLPIRYLARAMLVHPRYLPYAVASALYRDARYPQARYPEARYQAGKPASESRTTSAPAS